MKNFIAVTLILLMIPIFLLSTGSIFLVKETEYCIQTRMKAVVRTIEEPNLFFKIPFIDKTFFYPSKYLTVDPSPENIVTGDQKKLILDNYVKWKITDPLLFRENLATVTKGHDRVSIIALNALKDVIGKTQLHEIVSTKRDSITLKAINLTHNSTKSLGVEIKDIRIKSLDMPFSNIQKSFERMKAERYKQAHFYRSRGDEEAVIIQAETDKEITELLALSEKEAAIIKAKAEAKAAAIYSTSYKKDPHFYSFYRSLKTLEKTIDTTTTLILSPKSELYKYLVNP